MTDTVDPNADVPPNKSIVVAGEEKDDEEPAREIPEREDMTWKVLFKPQWITVLLNRTKIIYGFTITFWYLW